MMNSEVSKIEQRAVKMQQTYEELNNAKDKDERKIILYQAYGCLPSDVIFAYCNSYYINEVFKGKNTVETTLAATLKKLFMDPSNKQKNSLLTQKQAKSQITCISSEDEKSIYNRALDLLTSGSLLEYLTLCEIIKGKNIKDYIDDITLNSFQILIKELSEGEIASDYLSKIFEKNYSEFMLNFKNRESAVRAKSFEGKNDNPESGDYRSNPFENNSAPGKLYVSGKWSKNNINLTTSIKINNFTSTLKQKSIALIEQVKNIEIEESPSLLQEMIVAEKKEDIYKINFNQNYYLPLMQQLTDIVNTLPTNNHVSAQLLHLKNFQDYLDDPVNQFNLLEECKNFVSAVVGGNSKEAAFFKEENTQHIAYQQWLELFKQAEAHDYYNILVDNIAILSIKK